MLFYTAAPKSGKLVTLIAGKWRRLLFAGHGRRNVYDKKRQRFVDDNRTEFLSRVSTLTRDIDIAILYVCLSVCLSVRGVPVLDENDLT